jgi:hypothetical protein
VNDTAMPRGEGSGRLHRGQSRAGVDTPTGDAQFFAREFGVDGPHVCVFAEFDVPLRVIYLSAPVKQAGPTSFVPLISDDVYGFLPASRDGDVFDPAYVSVAPVSLRVSPSRLTRTPGATP